MVSLSLMIKMEVPGDCRGSTQGSVSTVYALLQGSENILSWLACPSTECSRHSLAGLFGTMAVMVCSRKHSGFGSFRWKTWIVILLTTKLQFTSLVLLFVLSAGLACVQFEAVGGQFEDPGVATGVVGRLIGRLHLHLVHGSHSRQGGAMGQQPSITLAEDMSVATRTLNELPEEVFFCDRSHWRTDVCVMRGYIRMSGKKGAISLLSDGSRGSYSVPLAKEHVKAFPGKKDPTAMEEVANLTLQSVSAVDWELGHRNKRACARTFEVPAVVFSMGGIPEPGTEEGVWHDFNNILVPLYLTTYSYERMVLLVVHQEQEWFLTKYQKLLEAFTMEPIVPLSSIPISWCFNKVIVGLQSKGPLYVPATVGGQPPNPQDLIERWGRSLGVPARTPRVSAPVTGNLVLGIIRRRRTRMITAEAEARMLVEAQSLGFSVDVLELEEMSLEETFARVQGLDVLLGVVGVGLTNLLFLRPNSVLINIVPWGCEPRKWDIKFAVGTHLQYVEYLSVRGESSLIRRYTRNHTAFTNPKRQWEMDPDILLSQNLNLTSITAHDVLTQAKYLLTTPEGDRI